MLPRPRRLAAPGRSPFTTKLQSIIFFKAGKKNQTPKKLLTVHTGERLREALLDQSLTRRPETAPGRQTPDRNLHGRTKPGGNAGS